MLIFLRVVPPEGCGRNISNERRDKKKKGLAQLFFEYLFKSSKTPTKTWACIAEIS